MQIVWSDKEVRRIILDIVCVVLIVTILTFLWWGPYQDKIRVKTSLQQEATKESPLVTNDLDIVAISQEKTHQMVQVVNEGDTSNSYMIQFMVEQGKNDPNTIQNNYVMYSIVTDNYVSEPRNLSLDGYMLTSTLLPGEEKEYEIILWSNNPELQLDGQLAVLPHYHV